ncbi:MAG: nuclear transport factor 2 family protein [Candidatus Krumholzibacteria bacterium]|jgi:hypothetical protein|nr:nuclear transport factor 2 family protein [Candidatus Krumholzibacteria bacterium]
MAIVVLAVFFASCICSNSSSAMEDSAEAVKKVIEESYIRGIHIERNIPAIRKGFHPDFTMFILKEGAVEKLSISEWIESIEKSIAENPDPPKREITWNFPMVEVSGDAAVARIEMYRDGKHIFTDFMSLYRFSDGWKIVGKIYFRH